MEGGAIHQGANFGTCLALVRQNPFLLRLALSAGLGGFLFGYDTGVISGALLYIKDDFSSVDNSTSLQEVIVSGAIAGAIIGAASGGWINDKIGRKKSLTIADIVFLVGAVFMAASNGPALLIIGRVCVGLGIGMASMASPLYISEVSPRTVRGAIVSTNGLLITGGQFLSYCINLAFTRVSGTWRWMLGIASLPAILQLMLMFFLPESPRWLFRKGKEEESFAVMQKLHPPEDLDNEMEELRNSVQQEIDMNGPEKKIRYSQLWTVKEVRYALIAGCGIQICQQMIGINTVMYYSPTIVQQAGFASNRLALLLSLITSGLNTGGTILSMYLIDRTGRRKLLIASLMGVIFSLAMLTAAFHITNNTSPFVSPAQTKNFTGLQCPGYHSSSKQEASSSNWTCVTCLKVDPACGFCASAQNQLMPGACLLKNRTAEDVCNNLSNTWFSEGCPSKYGALAIAGLALYIIFYAPGIGTLPWVINSEIYPLRFRGICGGLAATSNWIANLIVSQTFLTMTKSIGTSNTFMVFGIFAVISLFFVIIVIPETKGLSLEEVEGMLQEQVRRFSFKFWKNQERAFDTDTFPDKVVASSNKN